MGEMTMRTKKKKRDYSIEFRKLALVRKGLAKAFADDLTLGKIERYAPFSAFTFRYEKRFITAEGVNDVSCGGCVTVNGDTGLLHLVIGGSGRAVADNVASMIALAVENITKFAN
jgi:hypothetical protein